MTTATTIVVFAQVCIRRLVASLTTVFGMAWYYGSSSGAEASGDPDDGPGSASSCSEQKRLYYQISTKLCIQAAIPMEAYIQRNGLLSDEHPFGEFHWRGLIEEYTRYSWRHKLAEMQNLQIGWVLIPRSFSQRNAMLPSCPVDSMYYPAVIDQDPEYGQLARMACNHIAIMSARPWWIHASRLCQLRSFMDVKRHYDGVEYRRKTQNHLIRGAPGAMMDRGTLDGSQERPRYYDMVD